MQDVAPLERFAFFQDNLGLTEADVRLLEPHRALFLGKKAEFLEYLHGFLSGMEESRRILELMEAHGGLRKNWAAWYQAFFTEGLGPRFYDFLWNSGLKHVQRNVDQRYINLSYCVTRLFLRGVVERELPESEARSVVAAVDKMLDLCLMVATDAFLATTTQCDREVINGIAHQVRNPLTVIGGFIRNLKKRAEEDTVRSALDTMYQETVRLENMVHDVGSYIEIDQREPVFSPFALDALIEGAVRRLEKDGWPEGIRLETGSLEPDLTLVTDRSFLEEVFYQLLKNAMEAALADSNPLIRVSRHKKGEPPRVATVEIFNNGRIPKPDELPHLFTPFYSSKPTRSGFGLPIAALAARKAHAEIDLRVIPGEGTVSAVTLPLFGR